MYIPLRVHIQLFSYCHKMFLLKLHSKNKIYAFYIFNEVFSFIGIQCVCVLFTETNIFILYECLKSIHNKTTCITKVVLTNNYWFKNDNIFISLEVLYKCLIVTEDWNWSRLSVRWKFYHFKAVTICYYFKKVFCVVTQMF